MVGLLGQVTLDVPTEVLQYFPKYLSLIVALCLAVCITHVNLVSYLLPGSYAIVNLIPPFLNLRFSGTLFAILSLVFSMGFSGHLSFQYWIRLSGLVAGGVAGVIMSDYYAVRLQRLRMEHIYRLCNSLPCCGFNLASFVALAAGYGIFSVTELFNNSG